MSPNSGMKDSQKVLISACLLGKKVRYDGNASLVEHELIRRLLQGGQVISLCPEVAGGLPVPREKCEIKTTDNGTDGVLTVVGESGLDHTGAFERGAKKALELVQIHKIKFAILKSKSPSCGNKEVYDGTFSNTLISGFGVTAQLLRENGVVVFNETQLDELSKLIP